MEQMAANDLIATEEENNFYNSLWWFKQQKRGKISKKTIFAYLYP
jgi:hypothetical protein